MSKKLILFLTVAFFLLSSDLAFADLVISDIVFDPLGADVNAEYIKVQNTGVSPVDLSTWYVADYDTSWHFHKIIGENATSLPTGAYALIANASQTGFTDFKTKMPNWAGLIFRASFALANEKGRLALSSDKKNIVSDITYSAPLPPPKTPALPAPVKLLANNSPSTATITKESPAKELLPSNTASVASGVAVDSDKKDNSYSAIAIFAAFISAGAVAVYFIRRKRVTSQAGDDFEILDE